MEVLENLKKEIQYRSDKHALDNDVKSISSQVKTALPHPKVSASNLSIQNLRQMAIAKFKDENIISPKDLFALLSSPDASKKVLVFDVRNINDYLEGHINKCSSICIDPDWLRVSNNSRDLESCITAFGSKDLSVKKLFQSRGEYETIVYCDYNSNGIENDLIKLHQILYEWEFDIVISKHPKVLDGGNKGILFIRFIIKHGLIYFQEIFLNQKSGLERAKGV